MALTTIIAYDISEDARRARVAGVLQRHGDRIQYSVFLCRLDEALLTEVVDTITPLIDRKTDSIYVFNQCADCWTSVQTIGQAHPPEPVLYWAVF